MRYSFRQCFYAQTAAAAIAPQMIKALGKNKKIAFLTPDYTYGHTVRQSMEEFLKPAGWTTATNQVCPLGAPDYSSYMLNIANSGAEVFININFGNDAVQSIKQAKQFGVLAKMTLVVPYNTPFLAKDVGADVMQGVLAATDFWWTLEDKYPLAKIFVAEFEKKYGYKPEWGANSAYMQLAMWADAVERAKSFYPPDVIKAYEAGQHVESTVGEVWFRPQDHQLVRPVVVVRGKQPSAMKNRRRLLRDRRGDAGRAADAETRRVWLQARRLRLIGCRGHRAIRPPSCVDRPNKPRRPVSVRVCTGRTETGRPSRVRTRLWVSDRQLSILMADMPDVAQEEDPLDAWRAERSLCMVPFARSIARATTAACCLATAGLATSGPADARRATLRSRQAIKLCSRWRAVRTPQKIKPTSIGFQASHGTREHELPETRT